MPNHLSTSSARPEIARALPGLSAPAVFAILLMPLMLNAARATASEQTSQGCSFKAGTYIIVLNDATGSDGRGVLSLQSDGTLAVLNSNQRGGSNFAPFTSQLGTWECKRNRITARTINFTLPNNSQQQQIARVDYKAILLKTGKIQGSLEVRFFPLTANPQAANPAPAFTNTFTGQLVQAK